MYKYLILLLVSISLLGIDVSVVEQDSHSLTLKFTIPEPQEHLYKFTHDSLHLPRWSTAQMGYNSETRSIAPYFIEPLLIPPTGELPNLQILDAKHVSDRRFTNIKIYPRDLLPDSDFLSLNQVKWIDIKATEDFRSYRTAQIVLIPYAVAGQRLTEMTVRLDFHHQMMSGAHRDQNLVKSFINSELAQNWSQTTNPTLKRFASSLPQGQWYQIPINTTGIHRITPASLGESLPDTDPLYWQIYAPFYEGMSLPFALSELEPTPDNLKPIGMELQNIGDGAFTGDAEILFFAQSLNGDFKGDNFVHLYDTQRYYWLCIPHANFQVANQVNQKISSTTAPTHTVTGYEKRWYHENELQNQLHSGSSWVGEKLKGSSDRLNFSFDDNYLDFNSSIQFDALIMTDYDAGVYSYDFDIELNGLPFNISYNTPPIFSRITLKGTAGENILQDGFNTLSLLYSSNSNNSIIYLDSIRLAYTRKLAPSEDYLLGTLHLPGAVNRLIFSDTPSDFMIWDISDITSINSWQINNRQFVLEDTSNHEIIGFTADQIMDVSLSPATDFGQPVLRQPNQQADYIIITPEIFRDEAERIKELRENQVPADEQLQVQIVLISDIYQEFSAGVLDPAAIKHFLHYVYFNWDQPQLRYVLLLGDTDYDYRNISGQSGMIIPTCQIDGVSELSSYATDDIYTFIASGISDSRPDIAIGRLPAKNQNELTIMVDKIISYELIPERGIWSNTITLVADDPLRPSNSIESYHIGDTEILSSLMPSSMHVNKIYLTEYPEVSDPLSPYVKKPKAREDLLQKLYNGTLIVNYLGHGSPHVWAQEEVFTVSDLGLVNTGLQLPFWIAGTCDWAKYDDINSSCVPEELMIMENNGAVGLLSTTRKTFPGSNFALISSFYQFLFPEPDGGRSIAVGDAVMLAKNVTGSDTNKGKYVLFSDPALRLGSPVRKGHIQSVNPAVLQAMGRISYTGITDTTLSSESQAVVTVYDTPTAVTRSYDINTTGSVGHISYTLPGKRIFRGRISVDDQDFSGDFILPKDIKYSGDGGIMRVQYWDETGLDGSTYIDTLSFRGTDSTGINNTGPDILFLSENMMLINGDHFSANEALEIEIKDEQGINLTGMAGHGISLAIDEDWVNANDVTELFEYDLDHSDMGRLSAYLSQIPPGDHTITVKAWDSQNNPNTASIRLEFFAATDFRVYDLFNFPNPMAEHTDITYMLSHAGDIDCAIYTLAGRKILGESLGYQAQGFNSFPWDGRDIYGNSVANGVYIVVIEAASGEFTDPTQSFQKLVVAR